MRLSDGGRFATDSPGRHSVAGRMGRGVKPPPQFGRSSSAIAVYLLVRDRSEAFSCGSGRTSKRGLNIQRFRLRELCAFLDEAETRIRLGAHQRIDC